MHRDLENFLNAFVSLESIVNYGLGDMSLAISDEAICAMMRRRSLHFVSGIFIATWTARLH